MEEVVVAYMWVEGHTHAETDEEVIKAGNAHEVHSFSPPPEQVLHLELHGKHWAITESQKYPETHVHLS